MPLPQMVPHSQGGESHPSPDTQGVLPDQAQAAAPQAPDPEPQSTSGPGASGSD